MAEKEIMSQEAYDNLVAELEELVSVKRGEVGERLKEARAFGDLSENAEYDAAKSEQAELEARILELQNKIKNSEIIDDKGLKTDKVSVGLQVKVTKVETKETEEFIIVGSLEADPFSEPEKISNDSVLGESLLGRKKGDTVEVVVPNGIFHYKIEKISKAKGKKS